MHATAHRTVLAALLAACAACGREAPAPAPRPNIVLVVSDDHDYEQLGFLGRTPARTPAIDALAAQGVVFPYGHAMSRCRPALAALLTGQEAHRNGIFFNQGPHKLAPSPEALPALLAGAGYRTFAQGKFFEGDPRAFGFQESPGHDFGEFVRRDQEELFAFLDGIGDEPFFVWWAPMLPHVPHDPPERFRALYDPARIAVPPWIPPEREEEVRRLEATSLAMVSWLDDGLRQLVARLRARGLEQRTLIVFLIDNGWANGFVSKGSPFEKGVRTPLIFTWPGHYAPRLEAQLVSILDVAPTLLDLAGVEIPGGYQGHSLRPALEGRPGPVREVLHGACYPAWVLEQDARAEDHVFALYARDERWKYVLWLRDVREEADESSLRIKHLGVPYPERRAGEESLYDLAADPYERRDLSDRPELADVRQRLREGTLEWWHATGGGELRR